MAKRVSLISIFVLLNMVIGRMFQESLGIVCFSELSILAITSFSFWNMSAKQIKVWANKWTVSAHGKNMLVQGGLGLSATAFNILIGQALVIFLMTTVHGCSSPSFNILNASLTNNIAVNLLCYFALLFYFFQQDSKNIPSDTFSEKLQKDKKVSVTRNGTRYFLDFSEIVYVETSNNCIILYTTKGKFAKYQSLKSFSLSICTNTFKRVHRSFLVNTSFIDHLQKNQNGDGILFLSTGAQIKFSRTYNQSIAT